MKFLILFFLGIIIVGCDNENDVLNNEGDDMPYVFTHGTYALSNVVQYLGSEECTGDGLSNICTTDESIYEESECPVGVCSDFYSPAGTECEAAGGTTLDGVCYTFSGSYLYPNFEIPSNEACVEQNGNWIIAGWESLLTIYQLTEQVNDISFQEDGTFIDQEGNSGTFSLEDNIFTFSVFYCDAYDGELYTNQIECESEGMEWVQTDIPTGVYNEFDGSITISASTPAECDYWEYDLLTKEQCESEGYQWIPASCNSFIFSK